MAAISKESSQHQPGFIFDLSKRLYILRLTVLSSFITIIAILQCLIQEGPFNYL
ncbi:hypothetical protein BDQ12DRAFT_108358 [Crucibulum laeve]|uniref:Uncharacterized protein n=1 Tax=Crucibulum laeve TaxID=68775 RepID=A0A5C3LES5_9AGAR|nr:hypothetical protein BDQ12DRAFT_108358 [Crucibulum laeve]